MAELAIEYMPGLAHLADAEPEEVIAELAQLNRISTAERNDRTALVRELARELAKLPTVSVGQDDDEPFAPSAKGKSTSAGFTEGSDDEEGADEDDGEDFDEDDDELG